MKILSRKIKTVYANPKSILIKFMYVFSPIIDEKIYIKMLYRIRLGKQLNLKNPINYTEKLQWIKINDRKDIYTIMADKFEMKNYVSNLIGEEFVVDNYGVWDNFDDIDFSKLPDKFVLKTTHDQGGVIICKDKKSFNIKEAKKKINKHLKRKHYYFSREWPYKNIKPRILAEKLLVSEANNEINDYKIYTFNGYPKVMYITSGRGSKEGMSIDFFDIDGKRLDIIQEGFLSNKDIKVPDLYSKMLELSKIISKGTLHLRVDFYIVNDMLYIGELTFFDGGGLFVFKPIKWDKIFGDWIQLPSLNKIK